MPSVFEGNSFMEKYEIAINIIDKNYIDSLIVALVRQGYNVYYNEDENVVCFTAMNDEVTQIKS
jgi:hypothetical protein